jgi:ribosomal protein S18 acetylase RimI-like enzyme
VILSPHTHGSQVEAPVDIQRRLAALPDSLVSRTYLLHVEQQVVGMLSIDIIEGEAELFEVYIARAHRCAGHGTRALRELDKLLISLEIKSLWLFPQSTDDTPTEALIAWYRKCGFVLAPKPECPADDPGLIKYYA